MFAKIRSWKAYVKFAFLLFLYAAVYAADLLILSAIMGKERLKSVMNGSDPSGSSIYIALLYISIIAASLWFWKIVSEKSLKDVFFSGKKNAAVQGLLWGAGLFAMFFIPGVASGLFYNENKPVNSMELIFTVFTNIPVSFALAYAEELIFRGIMMKIFHKDYGFYFSAGIISLVFAMAHMFSHSTIVYKILFFFSLFFLSMFFCVGNKKFGSIWFSSFMHFVLIYLLMLRNYLNLFKIPKESENYLFGLMNSPMSGIYASLILLFAIYIFTRKGHMDEKEN